MVLARNAGTDTPLERVETVTFCWASPLVTEWVGADAVRGDGVVRMVRERVFDRRLVDRWQRSVDAMMSSLRRQVTSVGGLLAAQIFMQSRVPLVVRCAEPPVDCVVDRGPEYRSQDRRYQIDP